MFILYLFHKKKKNYKSKYIIIIFKLFHIFI